MGILNATPDSFSGDGTMRNGVDWVGASIDFALRMEDEGADIIDIGGESTRPASVYSDARPVSADEELERVLPIISALKASVRCPHQHRHAQVGRCGCRIGGGCEHGE